MSDGEDLSRHQQEVTFPAKKWGDTEIAERGRSVLVMRARYRSAGLIPTSAGGRMLGDGITAVTV